VKSLSSKQLEVGIKTLHLFLSQTQQEYLYRMFNTFSMLLCDYVVMKKYKNINPVAGFYAGQVLLIF